MGTGLGIHANGIINIKQQKVNLEGTIVPFNLINSAIKDVPIIGEILTGRKGEGVIAINYSAKGNLNDPTVRINPLSVLTPGFLRRIFD